jgi:hypothetical protein
LEGALDEGVVGMKHDAVVDAGFPHRRYQPGPVQGNAKHREIADMHVSVENHASSFRYQIKPPSGVFSTS